MPEQIHWRKRLTTFGVELVPYRIRRTERGVEVIDVDPSTITNDEGQHDDEREDHADQ